jgi:hypothetical protein
MDATPATPADLIDRLDPDAIRAELDDLDRRASALRILLRAALARGGPRCRDSRQQALGQEGPGVLTDRREEGAHA